MFPVTFSRVPSDTIPGVELEISEGGSKLITRVKVYC